MDWPPGEKTMSYFLHYKVDSSFCFPKSPMKTGSHCFNCCIETSAQEHSPFQTSHTPDCLSATGKYEQSWQHKVQHTENLVVTNTTPTGLDDSTISFGKVLTLKYISDTFILMKEMASACQKSKVTLPLSRFKLLPNVLSFQG